MGLAMSVCPKGGRTPRTPPLATAPAHVDDNQPGKITSYDVKNNLRPLLPDLGKLAY